MSGGTVTVPAIDLSRATAKGEGLSRAAVNCPTTFRVNTSAAGDAELDVSVTGTATRRRDRDDIIVTDVLSSHSAIS